jgi:anti-sigma-K factor RskA
MVAERKKGVAKLESAYIMMLIENADTYFWRYTMLAALAVVAAVAGGVGAAVAVTNDNETTQTQSPTAVVEQAAPSQRLTPVDVPDGETPNPFLEVNGL